MSDKFTMACLVLCDAKIVFHEVVLKKSMVWTHWAPGIRRSYFLVSTRRFSSALKLYSPRRFIMLEPHDIKMRFGTSAYSFFGRW